MYLPCFAFMLYLSGSMCVANSTYSQSHSEQVVLKSKFGVNHSMNYSLWHVRLFKPNSSLLSTGDKRINLRLNKEFSLHALHFHTPRRGENFLVSARYTF